MNFNNFLVESKNVDVFLLETSKILNGQEVADELGISRVAVKKTTQKALTKVFTAVESSNTELTPFQVLLSVATMLDVINDKDGIVTILRNISAAQKKSIMDDIKINYPTYDVSRLGIK